MNKTVIVNGTFDIVHTGHVYLLNFARRLGTNLLVAIDSDRRVKELKGKDRPINNQEDRKLMLSNIIGVSQVFIFDSDEELENIIKEQKISIMVKGDDYVNKPIVGEHLVPYVVFMKKLNEYSTTKKIQDIIDRG